MPKWTLVRLDITNRRAEARELKRDGLPYFRTTIRISTRTASAAHRALESMPLTQAPTVVDVIVDVVENAVAARFVHVHVHGGEGRPLCGLSPLLFEVAASPAMTSGLERQ